MLKRGIYEQLINGQTEEEIREAEAHHLECCTTPAAHHHHNLLWRPFFCMGLVDLVSSHGDSPMNIEWRLERPAMPQFLKVV
jgi:hypothetical protein